MDDHCFQAEILVCKSHLRSRKTCLCMCKRFCHQIFLCQNFPRCNFSLVARYLLKFTGCLLLVVKSLLTCCRKCSWQKVTCHLLQKLLVAENHLLLITKLARYSLQKLLVVKIHSLLVSKFDRYLLHKVTK